MAKKLRYNYTFTPGSGGVGTVVLSGYVGRQRLLLITNVTRNNSVIYNFADSNLRATAYSYSSANDATTFTLNFDTSSHSATDSLMIFTEEDNIDVQPAETQLDPTNKSRVSTPQALIDTDFEYGNQTTKWEQIGMVNNRPGNFTYPQYINGVIGAGRTLYGVIQPSGSRMAMIAIMPTSATPAVGEPIQLTDSYLNSSNNTYYVEAQDKSGAVSGFTNCGLVTVTTRAQNSLTGLTSISDPNRTGLLTGGYFSYSNLGVGTFIALPDSPVRATSHFHIGFGTQSPHGLHIGNPIFVTGTTGTANTTTNGTHVVVGVPDPYTISVVPRQNLLATYGPGGFITTASITAMQVRSRTQATFLHRPFDGGVLFSSNATSNNEQAIRQTRRYFRYQSGKGIQMSTGTIMNPTIQIDRLTASGTAAGSVITIQTKEQHNLQGIIPGTQVQIQGSTTSGYNGTYTIASVTGYNKFTVLATQTLGSTTAAGNFYIALSTWVGAINRLGIFDQQNGLFWEYNGAELAVVRRNSTFQVSGRYKVFNGSSAVYYADYSPFTDTGNFPGNFPGQVNPGDFIVIRGQSYRVVQLGSRDTSDATVCHIAPPYRGPDANYVTISKTVDTRVVQNDFNIDKCNLSGPSGYNVDLTKMQMFYIDYTWYGAGFVRYGLRGPRGNVIYVHKTQNNNVNSEAYMRSGNLPARYESVAFPPTALVTNVGTGTANGIAVADNYIGIGSTALFPPAGGTILVRNPFSCEYMNYTGIAATGCLTGIVRVQSGVVTGVIGTVSAGSPTIQVAATSKTNEVLQVGQRIIHPNFPDGTYVASIGGGSGVNGIITASNAATGAITAGIITCLPMSGGFSTSTVAAVGFAYSVARPTTVELAWPTYAPGISHWGSSVIMDGRFDNDKSLVFTYGTTSALTISPSGNAALFSIRVAPSADTGTASPFGQREIVNRMQLTLNALDISVVGVSTANLLIRAYLNATPSSNTLWTNAVGNADTPNSSLAQIADYTAGTTTLTGGEVIAGYWVAGTGSVDLSGVRDLGNCINGGGGSLSNSQIYPDGPDTLTIYASNLTPNNSVRIFARLSWTEAQA